MTQAESIAEASIEGLAAALTSGSLTAVDLVAKHLLRIGTYDCRNTALNSIPLLNENIFDEAAASDDRRALGKAHGLFDGIPFTVKDSYKVKGMTVSCGSEAFKDLVANEDAFLVSLLRSAGAVLVGKTNMCPMAYGGMLRGFYGRAESPYNSDYLPAAFGSGSSQGSGVSVASSFAAFGLGGETVSSGRSPASNNALITYTPSRGMISPRGSWPLYPTCDIVISHTRTMDDLLALLDVIMAKDPETTGDFWRDQSWVSIPAQETILPRPVSSIRDIGYLTGKRIAVPRMYITQCDGGPYVSESILPVWNQAKADLEAAGATVEIVEDFPVIQAYENPKAASGPRLPEDWNSTERGALIAHGWEDFLQENASSHISSLNGVPPTKMFPHFQPSDPEVKFTEPANAVHWSKLASYAANGVPSSRPGKSAIYDIPRLEDAVNALENMRKHYFEDWLSIHDYDYVAFPAVGDVARANADAEDSSAEHAWRNGVKYSHGNRALRHLGIPSVTVPMGILESQQMPIGLTVLGRAYDDVGILRAGYVFEQKSQRRIAPPLVPALTSDAIPSQQGKISGTRPKLEVTKCSVAAAAQENLNVSIEGNLTMSEATSSSDRASKPHVEIFVDGIAVNESNIHVTEHPQQDGAPLTFRLAYVGLAPKPPTQEGRNVVAGRIARDSTMVMVIARNGEQGRPSGYLKLVHGSDI
ncbi:hypothetical protein OHC33_005007 [Knufia fluminis]|uniref:Amidase domain-containing protein n=1 Tax=Knufia fluminis TaxID=191047 RepID=A0AAN8EKX4_9EURO|nr:hypothetical protein OHC33_005007 [Knufia fluminis]